ncbi:galactonate dehydratase [Phytoactinopolyspora mesophila]|uniref:Galactonate dehydratase n=1 Tax=Phytoactinopolyspora mesophila TaxID=2650750 RepID=A0A7K3MAE2_9ACTN|nr:galactonate dehydratase [Phytoactinopolyspora mesophila]NDL60285.1 galactonate dehydratase [Phytoactinopolyspora mesophila]
MKITDIETFAVAPRWLFCRIATDEGIVGWGEPIVEGRAETVRAAVHELADYLIGQDPLRIEDHWQVLSKGGFYRGGPVLSSALAGLDQALWDIAGQAYDAPVHALLGGPVRDRVRMYTWIGGDEPAEIGEAVAEKISQGFTAVKMNGCAVMSRLATVRETDAMLARLQAAREALGPDRDVAVDFHGRVSTANARRVLPLLEPFHPLFIEEPVLPEHAGKLAAIVAASSTPIAMGERCYHRSEFAGPLQAGVSVVQPDISHAGGISEVRRVAALAEIYDAVLAPHCPLGPIALAASLQVAFATPNFLIQEQSLGIHYNVGNDLLDYLIDPSVFQFFDGYVQRPMAPGLGIQVDEAAVRRADETGHQWRSPVWRHSDGSFAEW